MINNESCGNSCSLCKKKSNCFTQLTEIELEIIDSKKVELSYKKGENIAKQGSFVTHILFLQSGLVKIYKELDGENNLILNLFSAGRMIGLPSLHNDSFLQYSVAAVENSVVCAIDKSTFESLILENGKFAAAIINSINNCTHYNFDKIVSLTQKQMNGRLAEALLFLSEHIYHADSFRLSLTRKDLAEFTGMSVMSVVRGLKEFKESKLISDVGSTISILNKEKLQRISVTG